MAERTGEERLCAQVEALLSSIELARGDVPAARRIGEGALAIAERMNQAYLQSEAWRSLAEVRLSCGEAEAVLAEYRARITALGDSDNALARNILAHVSIAAGLASGRYDEVEQLLWQRLEWVRVAGLEHSERILLTGLGRLLAGKGHWEESEAAFEQAITCCEAGRSPLQLARALAARARMWEARGHSSAGREDQARATALFDTCGAKDPSSTPTPC